MTTSRRIATVVMCLAVLALAVLAAASVVWTAGKMRDQLDQRVIAASGASAAYEEALDDRLGSYLESFAARPRLIDLVRAGAAERAELTDYLNEVQLGDRTLIAVSVLGPSGRLLATTFGPQYVGTDFSSRDYFRGVVRTGTTYRSTAYEGALGDLLSNAITPIRDRASGAVAGYLTAARPLGETQRYVASFSASAGIAITVADQAGNTVAATNGTPLGKRDERNAPWLTPALRGETGIVTVDKDGRSMVVSYRPLTTGWVVAAALPESLVSDQVGRLRDTTIVLTAGLSLVIVFVGLLLHRSTMARERQQREQFEERDRVAREVNDTIVQGLVAAEMSYDLGHHDHTRELLRTTSRQARAWVGEQLVQGGRLQPGGARRRRAAQSPTGNPAEPASGVRNV